MSWNPAAFEHATGSRRVKELRQWRLLGPGPVHLSEGRHAQREVSANLQRPNPGRPLRLMDWLWDLQSQTAECGRRRRMSIGELRARLRRYPRGEDSAWVDRPLCNLYTLCTGH